MRIYRWLPVHAVAVFAGLAFAIALYGQPVDVAAWREDLAYLEAELPARHKNAFFRVSESDFEAAVAALDQEIPSLDEHQIIVRFLEVVTMIGDAHTTVWGFSFHRLPIRLYRFSDGYFVIRTSEQYENLLGARLTHVGGKSIEEVEILLSTVIPHENPSWLHSRAPDFLVMTEVLHGIGLGDDPLRATVGFVTRNGEAIEQELSASEAANVWLEAPDPATVELPLYRQRAGSNYWYEYIASRRMIYLKYNVCRDIPGYPFSTLGEELAGLLLTKPVDRLVLDMRDNAGGNSSILQPLISGIQAMDEYNRPDRLFVIIGRRTFSSAVLNSIQLRQQTNATFVGEPSGGKPNSYGEVLSFELPNSKLQVTYSTKYFDLLPGEDPDSFEPDVYVAISSEDYFAAWDPVVESILPPLPRRRGVVRPGP